MEIILKKEDDKGYFVLDDEEEDDDGSPYILQRWSDKWHSYVDVSHIADILNGDKLKLLPCLESSQKLRYYSPIYELLLS